MNPGHITTFVQRTKVLLALVASLVVASLASAEVRFAPASGDRAGTSGQPAIVLVSGEIGRDDLGSLLALVRVAREDDSGPAFLKGHFQVRLDSAGGDVETAIAMGRILRREGANAVVLANSRCFSACVFVLAGAVNRSVSGAVGIHRPYAPLDSKMTASAQKQWYERLGVEVKAFLQAVNIREDLYDDMLRIPPQSVKVLSPDELQRYGLSEDDPYETAAGMARAANANGITTEELIRRMAQVNAECTSGNSDRDLDCVTQILKEGHGPTVPTPVATVAPATYTVYGYGTDSCGQWSTDRSQVPTSKYQVALNVVLRQVWIQGYADGASAYAPLRDTDIGTIVTSVSQYCASRPHDGISKAAAAVLETLRLSQTATLSSAPRKSSNLASSCGKWLAELQHSEQLYRLGNMSWLTGFVSGAGRYGEPLRETDGAGMGEWVGSYCSRRPLDSVHDAVTALLRELGR